MEIQFFNDPDQVPQPKDKIKIEDVRITPYPDRFRVYIEIDVTPFQERPNLLVVAYDEDDRLISELDIIATMHNKMEFTMHIRGKDDPAGNYRLQVELFYESRNPPQDAKSFEFMIPEASEE